MVNFYKLLKGFYSIKRKNPHTGEWERPVPVLVIGKPGLGKTRAAQSLARSMNKPFVGLNGSQMTEVDTVGIVSKVDTPKGPRAQFLFLDWVYDLQDNTDGVLLLDEFTTASSAIQSSMLSLAQDARCNALKLDQTTFRIICANPSDIKNCSEISTAFSNRCAVIDRRFDASEFKDSFAADAWQLEEPIINSAQDAEKKELQYRLLMEELVAAHPTICDEVPEEIIEVSDYAYATPRSLENCAFALSFLDKNDDEYVRAVIESIIGKDAGLLLWKLIKSKNDVIKIDLEDYIGQEDKFVLPNPEKHDQAAQIMKSAMYWLKRDALKVKKLWIRVANVLHNKDNKFGKYVGYDGIISKYTDTAVKDLYESVKNDIKARQQIFIEINKDLDDWSDLHGSSVVSWQ